jgi:hypothetical protein
MGLLLRLNPGAEIPEMEYCSEHNTWTITWQSAVGEGRWGVLTLIFTQEQANELCDILGDALLYGEGDDESDDDYDVEEPPKPHEMN